MSYLNSFLEKQTTVKKRKVRSDKKNVTHVWMSDENYQKIFLVARKNRQTITQFCSNIVINQLENATAFSLVEHRTEYRQVNVKLSQPEYEQIVELSAQWGCIPIRHAVSRVLISGLREAGVL